MGNQMCILRLHPKFVYASEDSKLFWMSRWRCFTLYCCFGGGLLCIQWLHSGAVQDAGVPLRRRVAGVAMGLILDDAAPEGSVILTDIMGVEDALGDMDFKVAGDAESISALQMDIKVEGITITTMRRALAAARDGRRHILEEMAACRPPPRRALSKHCPRILSLPLPENQIGALIGPGGGAPCL